jgi:DNA repair protein RadA/Sms
MHAADRSRPLACFGELGLTGELRTVAHGDRRVAEAKRFGLEPVISPASHGILRAALGSALGRTDPGGMRAEETEIAA